MKLTFLGTGTSYGVPFVACDCDVCTSENPRNKRLRASILVDDEKNIDAKNAATSTRILVDTTPDLRQQLLRENVRHLSAVFWTHSHNDHIIGLDDLRPLCDRGGYIPAFADEETSADLQRVFGYALQENREHGGFPRVKLREAKAFESVQIGEISVMPLLVSHGARSIFAYRFQSANRVLVYATDCSQIPAESREKMRDADVFILGALRHKAHPAHFTLDEALRHADELNAKRAYFTHIAHDLEHEAENAKLPPNRYLAFDGLQIEI